MFQAGSYSIGYSVGVGLWGRYLELDMSTFSVQPKLESQVFTISKAGKGGKSGLTEKPA
jgi:hypothetical protein